MPYEALPLLVPPFRFGIVEEGLYRGAYPTLKNFRFLRRLHLRSMVVLSSEPLTRDLREFCDHEHIAVHSVYADKFEDAPTLTSPKVARILTCILNADLHPLYLHCRDGGHNTGHVVMCLRRLQNWNLSVIFSEFCRYVKGGEIRLSESQFVESFKAEVVIPRHPPTWLWAGARITRHPCVRLRWEDGGTANEAASAETPALISSPSAALQEPRRLYHGDGANAPRAAARRIDGAVAVSGGMAAPESNTTVDGVSAAARSASLAELNAWARSSQQDGGNEPWPERARTISPHLGQRSITPRAAAVADTPPAPASGWSAVTTATDAAAAATTAADALRRSLERNERSLSRPVEAGARIYYALVRGQRREALFVDVVDSDTLRRLLASKYAPRPRAGLDTALLSWHRLPMAMVPAAPETGAAPNTAAHSPLGQSRMEALALESTVPVPPTTAWH
ncbi:hypothetical protein CDCA_CDCA18G4508 [Cyanidium caldarium]|uniref:Tyrosine phosphatase n=1 Tax=Cyanidium caldarium TaxID=2771 RepID=A0AAV9J1K2_CYACA|nr:hypothetical protein CDCA_CDCA18G4508 [Cyanidium caldarium]